MCKETQPPIDGWVSSFFMIVFMISLKKRLKKGVYNEHTRARYLASSRVWKHHASCVYMQKKNYRNEYAKCVF